MSCGGKCGQTKLITHINVTQFTLEGEDNVNAWKVKNQTHIHVIYNLNYIFIEYASFTCKWALCGNLCKHQVIILLACSDLTNDDIINYCGMWYGSNRGGLNAMFVDLKYLQVHDGSSEDESYEEDMIDGAYVVDIGGFLDIDDNSLFSFDGVHNDEHESSSTPMY